MRFPRQLRLVLTTKSLRFGAYFLRASFRRGRYLAPLIAQNIAASRAICAPRNRPCRATPQIWSLARLRGQPLDPVRYKIAFRVELPRHSTARLVFCRSDNGLNPHTGHGLIVDSAGEAAN